MAENSSVKVTEEKIKKISLILEDLNRMLLIFNELQYIVRQFKGIDKKTGTTNLAPEIPDNYYEISSVAIRHKLNDLIDISGNFRSDFFPLTDPKNFDFDYATPSQFMFIIVSFLEQTTTSLIVGEDFITFIESSISRIKEEKKFQFNEYRKISKTNVRTKAESDAIFNIAFNSPIDKNFDLRTNETNLTEKRKTVGQKTNEIRKDFYRALNQGNDVVNLTLSKFLKVTALEVVTRAPWDQKFEEVKLRAINRLYGNIGKFCSTTTQNRFDSIK